MWDTAHNAALVGETEMSRKFTVLFVQGTGVRAQGFKETMTLLGERLVFPDLPEFTVRGCLWGEQYGSRRAEKSIFRYADSGGPKYTAEDAKSDMWRLL